VCHLARNKDPLKTGAPSILGLVGNATFAPVASDYETRNIGLRNAKFRLSVELFSDLCQRYQPGFRSFQAFLIELVLNRLWRYFQKNQLLKQRM